MKLDISIQDKAIATDFLCDLQVLGEEQPSHDDPATAAAGDADPTASGARRRVTRGLERAPPLEGALSQSTCP